MDKRDEDREITVKLTLEQFRTLWRLAFIDGHPPEEVARIALVDYLHRELERSNSRVIKARPMTEEERRHWREDFAAAVEAIRAGVDPDASPEALEEAITLASEQVRQERLRQLRASSA
jgi:hypothetical protein